MGAGIAGRLLLVAWIAALATPAAPQDMMPGDGLGWPTTGFGDSDWQSLTDRFDGIVSPTAAYTEFPEFPIDIGAVQRDLAIDRMPLIACDDLARASVEFGPWVSSLNAGNRLATRCGTRFASYFEQLPEFQFYCPAKSETAICSGQPAVPISIAGVNGTAAKPTSTDGPYSQRPSAASEAFVFPSVVALTDNKAKVECTGTIVGRRTVLTAAHCVCDRVPAQVFIGTSMSEKSAANKGLREFRSTTGEAVIFRDFCANRYSFDVEAVDLALLYLSDEVKPYFIAALGWDYAEYADPRHGTMVGFGTSEDANGGGLKRYGFSTFRACEDPQVTTCRTPFEYLSNRKPGEADTCFGDSGGPVFSDGRLVGVTSRQIGGGDEQYCGSGGVYVALSRGFNRRSEEVQDWLRRHIR